MCSAWRFARQASPSVSASPPPSTSTWGETYPLVWLNDYRLAYQLGKTTTDEVIIRNLPLHLVDSARKWLEHLPPSQIHSWDDLVRTVVGNFQGTYVRPGTPGTYGRAPKSPTNRSSTSYDASPSAALSSQAWLSPRSCMPSSRARPVGTSCASSSGARRSTPTSCSTSPPALLLVRRRWANL
jgi:hypothetical protein